MKTLIDSQEERQAEYEKAREEMSRYAREVVDPEVERLKKKLFPIVKEKGEIYITLALDGRYLVKNPKEPYPNVKERKYKIRITGHSSSDSKDGWIHYVGVQWWNPIGSYDGPHSRGKPGWSWVEGHHLMLVLKKVAEEELPPLDPENFKEAQIILLRKLEGIRDTLTCREQAALVAVQDRFIDPAFKIENRF